MWKEHKGGRGMALAILLNLFWSGQTLSDSYSSFVYVEYLLLVVKPHSALGIK